MNLLELPEEIQADLQTPPVPLEISAFSERCLRQIVMLGLADINKNLLTKFVTAIAESRDWCGYCPLEFYRHGKSEQAYALLVRLMAPELKRREYPEVSYAVLETLAMGLLGIQPDAAQRSYDQCSAHGA